MTAHPIAAIGAIAAAAPDGATLPVAPSLMPATIQAAGAPAQTSFFQMISKSIDQVSQKAADADDQVKAFILDDSMPPYRVIYALEKSQMSLQMMLQVRNRVVEGYQEIMRMQL